MKRIKKFRKSQILTFGSFLLFIGVLVLTHGHLNNLREEVFEQVRLSLFGNDLEVAEKEKNKEKVTDSSDVANVSSDNNSVSDDNKKYSYSYKYIGYLEIPKIRLKRGFLSKEDKYNNIEYNVTVSLNGNYPDEAGNFILIAHSGDAYISYFAYLYKLKIGDFAYVTYKDKKYKYQLVKIEEQPKTGTVAIHRPNYDVNGLTLITCTKDNDTTQSIYIFELV